MGIEGIIHHHGLQGTGLRLVPWQQDEDRIDAPALVSIWLIAMSRGDHLNVLTEHRVLLYKPGQIGDRSRRNATQLETTGKDGCLGGIDGSDIHGDHQHDEKDYQAQLRYGDRYTKTIGEWVG